MTRPRYRFTGRWGDRYYWERRIPGDSRVEQISCSVEWFWGPR